MNLFQLLQSLNFKARKVDCYFFLQVNLNLLQGDQDIHVLEIKVRIEKIVDIKEEDLPVLKQIIELLDHFVVSVYIRYK